jgi:hypothetical protein
MTLEEESRAKLKSRGRPINLATGQKLWICPILTKFRYLEQKQIQRISLKMKAPFQTLITITLYSLYQRQQTRKKTDSVNISSNISEKLFQVNLYI